MATSLDKTIILRGNTNVKLKKKKLNLTNLNFKQDKKLVDCIFSTYYQNLFILLLFHASQ